MSSTDLTEVDVVLTCSWGFDGSTGHSTYKQRYQNEQAKAVNDESLFVTTLIPLRLSSSTGIIFWNNRTTQSARFCHPLKLECQRMQRCDHETKATDRRSDKSTKDF